MSSNTYSIDQSIPDNLPLAIHPFLAQQLTQILFETAHIHYTDQNNIDAQGKIQLIFHKRSYIRMIEITPLGEEDRYLGSLGSFDVKVINKPREQNFETREEQMNYYKNMGYLKSGLSLNGFSFELDHICFYGYEQTRSFDDLKLGASDTIKNAPYTNYEIKTIEQIHLTSTDQKVFKIISGTSPLSSSFKITDWVKETKRISEFNHWQHGPLKLRYKID